MRLLLPILLFGLAGASLAEEPFALKQCELLPLPDDQVSFQIDGVEKTRWHFGSRYPRPFFYPLGGPSGTSLTRMGHPGAPNHDHHRSVWFAHHDVGGVDFWSDRTDGRVRQKSWYCYRDGYDHARAESIHERFAKRPGFQITKATAKHRQYKVTRKAALNPDD